VPRLQVRCDGSHSTPGPGTGAGAGAALRAVATPTVNDPATVSGWSAAMGAMGRRAAGGTRRDRLTGLTLQG